MNPLIRFMRHSLTSILTATDDADQVDIEKIDETLTPNMRALRLVMNMSDHLLSMGTPANSVVHMALGVTDTYCKRKVHIDVSFNQITLSQDRGIDREPLTLIRTISPRATDYRLMRKLQNLASQIADHKITLDDAESSMPSLPTISAILALSVILLAAAWVPARLHSTRRLYRLSWLPLS